MISSEQLYMPCACQFQTIEQSTVLDLDVRRGVRMPHADKSRQWEGAEKQALFEEDLYGRRLTITLKTKIQQK